MTGTPDVRLSAVERLLQTNQYQQAADQASDLATLADQDVNMELYYQARHLRAICLRMLGQYADSMRVFEELAHNLHLQGDFPVLSARILRDNGMLALDMGNPDWAYEMFRHSWMALEDYKEDLEAAVSLGFMGRVFGELDLLEDADNILRKHHNREYELNNLIWLMRFTPSMRTRFVRLSRAQYLATQLNSRQRYWEATLIAVNPSLYSWIKRAVRR